MSAEARRTDPGKTLAVLKEFKAKGFNVLIDMTAIDYSTFGERIKDKASFRMYQLSDDPKLPEQRSGPRFELVYHLLSLDPATGLEKARAEVRCGLEDGETGPKSAAGLWPAADWLEREIWDMYGISFADRSGIKRLLLYEEFQGHPLRKEYPIAKRQPLIGPATGEPENNPSFNAARPALSGE